MPEGIDRTLLDRLFSVALQAGIARLERDGHFFPLLFELRPNGAVQNVAVLETGPIEGTRSVLDRFFELLRPRVAVGRVRAAAIVLHRAAGRTMEVRFRAPGRAVDVEMPFEIAKSGVLRRRRRLALGEFVVRPAENELF